MTMQQTEASPNLIPGTPPAPASPPDPTARKWEAQRWRPSARFWPLLALVLLLLFNLVATRGFFHIEVRDGRLYGSLIDVLNRSAPLLLLSTGMTLVIATGGVDLSVGAVMAIAGGIAAGLILPHDGSVELPDSILGSINVHSSAAAVVVIALAAALACGVWNGVLVALLDVQPIVATLILMVAGRGVAQLLTAGQIITFHNPRLEYFGNGSLLGLPFPIYLGAAGLVVAGLLTRGTALGLFIESVGNNPTASRYAGVNAKVVKLFVYTVCGLLAGVAGVIMTADIKAADANNTGLYFELDAITAVCVGGTILTGGRFSLVGSAIGALLIRTLTITINTRGVDPAINLVVKATVIMAVCLLQSDKFRAGITGRFRRRTA